MTYFGTDGIRGEYGKQLTLELAVRVGKAAGTVFKKEQIENVVIGEDPRISSNVLSSAVIAGLLSTGINVTNLGIITTPIISYAILKKNYDAGIMISASHNPYTDNGIKFFGTNGQKLSDELELAIEEKIISEEYKLVTSKELGCLTTDNESITKYKEYVKGIVGTLAGEKIILDSANGSSYKIAKEIYEELGAEVIAIGTSPDGININDAIGSTHPEKAIAKVKENFSDNLLGGFTYDGDGDRVLLIDKNGKLLDGDYIIYILAKYLKANKLLTNNVIITTVMANLGLLHALDELGAEYHLTSVGDRYVMQEIKKTKAAVGGEQSGHIILPELLPTGDGILVSAYLTKILRETKLENIEKELIKYPQVLINIKVDDKESALANPEFKEEIVKVEAELGEEGRVLVRTSGTEELVRVMVEASSEEVCQQKAEYLAGFVK